jgi:hypothetical protein
MVRIDFDLLLLLPCVSKQSLFDQKAKPYPSALVALTPKICTLGGIANAQLGTYCE